MEKEIEIFNHLTPLDIEAAMKKDTKGKKGVEVTCPKY